MKLDLYRIEKLILHIANIHETGLCMTETRGTEAQMGTPKSLSNPNEKYMLTKWNKQEVTIFKICKWSRRMILNCPQKH